MLTNLTRRSYPPPFLPSRAFRIMVIRRPYNKGLTRESFICKVLFRGIWQNGKYWFVKLKYVIKYLLLREIKMSKEKWSINKGMLRHCWILIKLLFIIFHSFHIPPYASSSLPPPLSIFNPLPSPTSLPPLLPFPSPPLPLSTEIELFNWFINY